MCVWMGLEYVALEFGAFAVEILWCVLIGWWLVYIGKRGGEESEGKECLAWYVRTSRFLFLLGVNPR